MSEMKSTRSFKQSSGRVGREERDGDDHDGMSVAPSSHIIFFSSHYYTIMPPSMDSTNNYCVVD